MTTPHRNQGAILLDRIGKTQDAIADRCAVSRVAVSQWLRAATKPSPKKRDVIREAYGVPTAAWDELLAPKKTSKKSTPEPMPATPSTQARVPGDVIGKARMLEEMALQQMTDLRADESATPLEKAKVMNSVAATLNLLAKLTGQFDLGARLFQLPVWKRIERAIEDGLRGHPKAAAAVSRALRAAAEEFSQ